MTQEELNRYEEARKLRCEMETLRKAILIVSNSPLVRLVLQIKQGKRAVEKGYAAPSEVENVVKVVNADDPFDTKQMLERMSAEGWELVSTHQPNLAHFLALHH